MMYTTGSIGTMIERPPASVGVAVEQSRPTCLACGETSIGLTRTACPYCGTAFPRLDRVTEGVARVDIGAD